MSDTRKKTDLFKNFNDELDVELYWSRESGKFINKETGAEIRLPDSLKDSAPMFTGTVREWYETLVETAIDCRNQLEKKYYTILLEKGLVERNPEEAPRDFKTFLVAADKALTILETSVMYKSAYRMDENVGPFHRGLECWGDLSSRLPILSQSSSKSALYDKVVPDDQVQVVLHDEKNDITVYGTIHILDINII